MAERKSSYIENQELHTKMHDEMSKLIIGIGSKMYTPESTKICYEIVNRNIEFYAEVKKTKDKILILKSSQESNGNTKFVLHASDDIRCKEEMCNTFRAMNYDLKESRADFSIWEKVIAK